MDDDAGQQPDGGHTSRAARVRAVPARIVTGPVRAVARSVPVARAVRSGVGGVSASAGELLAAETERGIDAVLAGPLPERVARLMVERQVVERVLGELAASGDLERMVVTATEDARTEQLVDQLLASQLFRGKLMEVVEGDLAPELVQRLVDNPALQRVIADAVRTGVERQTATLADSVAVGARRLDGRLEAPPRRWLGRAPRPAPGPESALDVRFAGLGSRAAAFLIDFVTVDLVFLVGCALAALAMRLLQFGPSLGVEFGFTTAWWFVAAAGYFVFFWTAAGQTPGMAVLRLRVVDGTGDPPGPARAFVRLVAGVFSFAFLLIGFAPVLVDDRRRALPDLIAGTAVIYETADDVA